MWMPGAGIDHLVTQDPSIDHAFSMGAIDGSGATST
jgi:hypothetical protein